MSTLRTAVGVGVATVVAVLGFTLLDKAGVDLPDLPNPFDDGKDGEDEASGSVQVEGQTPLTATDTLVVKIGEGEATVSIKAHQNWDRPGNITDFDFQPTNGTASVRDPEDTDQPASITVGVEYCAEAEVTRTAAGDDANPGPPDEDEITFDMGSLFVCDVEWLPTEENEAAFHQDDTPAEFQGQFEEVIKESAIAAVAAGECPDRLVEDFTADEYLALVAEALAEREGVPVGNVTVTPGHRGTTSEATQEELRSTLERFTESDDLDIDAFSGAGTAIEDSCFIDTRGEPLDSLDDVEASDPRDF